MKNQYLGDIGDYGKYGLLRFLAKKGIRIGVNWYLTEDDGSNDGKFIGYLKKEQDRIHDEELFDFLASLVEHQNKSVQMIEDSKIIPNAIFYPNIVSSKKRECWHENAMKCLETAELIFCDPDNGPIGKKSITSKDSDKYIAPSEIVDYYNRGQNVVYYCQKARRTEEAWLATKTEMKEYLPDARIYVQTFHRGTQRSYIFVIHPEDEKRYANLLRAFEQTSWGRKQLFTAELFQLATVSQERIGNTMKIELDSGEVVCIRMCDDGCVEVISSKYPRKNSRRKAEDFVDCIR